MAVVTIARQIGSGGSNIAYTLAEELGYVVLDKNAVQEALTRAEILRRRGDAAMVKHDDSGLDEDVVETATSHMINEMRRLTTPARPPDEALNWPEHYWHPKWAPQRYIAFLRALILEAAEDDHVIIVGRGANFVLRNTPKAIRVFIGGSFERRVERLAKESDLSPRRAADIVARSDELRKAFVRKAFKKEWADPDGYDMLFNTDDVDDKTIIRRIAAAVREIDPTTFSTARPEPPSEAESRLFH